MDFQGYPEVDLQNLYLEDEKWNKIYYDSTIASLWSTKQTFKNVIWWNEYTLYWVVKSYYWWDEKFWLSLNTINGRWIWRVLSHMEYQK